MNFMGVGIMELGVILLVGFLVLGPGRSIDMARRAGKMMGDLRRAFSEVTDAISAEERERGQSPPQSTGPPPGVPTRPDFPDRDAPTPPGENPEPPQDGAGSSRV